MTTASGERACTIEEPPRRRIALVAAVATVMLTGLLSAAARARRRCLPRTAGQSWRQHLHATTTTPRAWAHDRSRGWVNVSCKVYDPYIASVNPDGYWYRIASSPWNNELLSPANTFMNGDPWGGPYTHNTDFKVPDCGSPPPPPSPTVQLAQGRPRHMATATPSRSSSFAANAASRSTATTRSVQAGSTRSR